MSTKFTLLLKTKCLQVGLENRNRAWKPVNSVCSGLGRVLLCLATIVQGGEHCLHEKWKIPSQLQSLPSKKSLQDLVLHNIRKGRLKGNIFQVDHRLVQRTRKYIIFSNVYCQWTVIVMLNINFSCCQIQDNLSIRRERKTLKRLPGFIGRTTTGGVFDNRPDKQTSLKEMEA